jgi:hypothetical protein
VTDIRRDGGPRMISEKSTRLPRCMIALSSALDGAHITRVKAGHLSLISRPNAVVRVIVSAVDATT